MSKRKAKTPQFKPAPSAIDIFRRANTEIHNIRVSTPILVIVQRLTTDEKFRERVVQLFK